MYMCTHTLCCTTDRDGFVVEDDSLLFPFGLLCNLAGASRLEIFFYFQLWGCLVHGGSSQLVRC